MIFFTFIFTFIFVFIFEMTFAFALNQEVPKECRYFGIVCFKRKGEKNFKSRDVTFSLFSKFQSSHANPNSWHGNAGHFGLFATTRKNMSKERSKVFRFSRWIWPTLCLIFDDTMIRKWTYLVSTKPSWKRACLPNLSWSKTQTHWDFLASPLPRRERWTISLQ